MTKRMPNGWLALVIAGLVLAGTGCAPREEMLRSDMAGSPEAPTWVDGQVPYEPDELFFVGRGGGEDVLDEQAAHREARADAMRQMAEQIATRVNLLFGTNDDRRERERECHPEFWCQTFDTRVALKAKAATSALVGDLEERDVYWEQWAVREHPRYGYTRRRPCWTDPHGRLHRYKCWVLMAVPRDKFEQRVQMTSKLVLREAAVDLIKAKEQLEQRLINAQRDAKLQVIENIWRQQAMRQEEAAPDVVFDVVDHHNHGLSQGGQNFTARDAEEILAAARIDRANGQDVPSSQEIQAMLESGRRMVEPYELLAFEGVDTKGSVDLSLMAEEAQDLSDAAARLQDIYEQLNASEEDMVPRPKLPQPELLR